MLKFVFALLILPGVVFAQMVEEEKIELDPIQEERFYQIAGDLRCPTCTGLSILQSDAAFSIQLRNMVRRKVKEGAARDDIMSFFVSRYGPWILRKPPTEGVHLLAWVLPLCLMIGGPLLVWFVFWRRKASTVGAIAEKQVDEILAEFEKRLAQKRAEVSN